VVKVDVDDEDRVDAARHALERAGATDVDEEAATDDLWGARRSSSSDAPDSERATSAQSWTGARDTSGDMREGMQDDLKDAETAERAIPVVREELKVGKRAEQAGGVRVFTRAVDEPVEETVTLREERAQVERRPVDREVTAEDRSRAEGATVEVRETVEKPVVQKVARVVEEVVVGKQVSERQERIRETLHNTEVEVQSLGTDRSRFAGDTAYREHFASQYGDGGTERYEDYEPAYRYGSSLASDPRYSGRPWDDIEEDARTHWGTSNPGSAWERFKSAVRHAWETATH
jgi:uncharacterized protein (TIGR02271 family)